MSNYLFAMGKEEKIHEIHNFLNELNPNSSDEISLSHQFDDYWALVLERRSSHIRSSISDIGAGGNGSFFKGWFQDHNTQSIALGSIGFKTWEDNHEYSETLDFEGTYVRAHWTRDKLMIENDLFSYFPVMFFSTPEVTVASDSMYVLSQIRQHLNLPCRLNHEVIHTRAWTHGLACAMMSNQTQIEGIQLLSPGKHMESSFSENISSKIIHRPIKEIFLEGHTNYSDALVEATRQLYASTMSFSHIDDIHINFGLSGGLDSRLLLAILLKKPASLSKVSISTNPHESRKGDFDVVERLAEKYGFNFNNKKNELAEHRKKAEVQSISEPNQFGFWILSNMGLFDMMYLHKSYWKHPNIIEMGGHGAETLKGTFTSMKFSNYLPRPLQSQSASWRTYVGAALHLFRDIRGVRFKRKNRKKIRSEMSNGLKSSGIDLAEDGSIQWHHLCYKSPIHNGRFLDRSIIALRPFIQKSLYSLSRSELNPFLNIKKGEPTLLHDMLILLDPELAAEPFENPKNDLTGVYIEDRIQAINREISFEDIKPYTIYGAVTDIVNGPPNTFMAMVNDYNIDGMEFKEAILEKLETQWRAIEDPKLKQVYQSAYDTAKERLLDPDFYPPSAGTPAAKIISLMMTDL